MIWIDYGIIALLISTFMMGLFKGAKQQAFSLLAWVLALLVGIFFSHDFSWLLKNSITDPIARIAAAFISLCLITQVVAGLIGLVLSVALKKDQLSLFDRLGGMVLGAAHGGLLVTLAILLAGLSVLPKSPWWHKSKLIPPFQTASVWISGHIESEFTKNIHYN